jgi:HlyD family secretion protein
MSNTSTKKTAAEAAAEAAAAAAAAEAAADIADHAAAKAQTAQAEQADSATQEALVIEAENAALEAQAAADRAAAAAQEALQARSAQDRAAATAEAAAREANAARAARAAAAAQEAGKARGANADREEQEANASRATAASRAAQEAAEHVIRQAQEQASRATAASRAAQEAADRALHQAQEQLAQARAAEERAAQAALAAKLAQEQAEQEAARAVRADRLSESERAAQAADAVYSSKAAQAAREAQDAADRAALAALAVRVAEANRAVLAAKEIAAARETQVIKAAQDAHAAFVQAQARRATQGERVTFARSDILSPSGQQSSAASGASPAYAQPSYVQPGQPAQSAQSSYAQSASAGAYNRPANTASSYSQQPARPGANAPFSQAAAHPVLDNDSVIPNFDFPNLYGQPEPELVPAAASGQTTKAKTAPSGQTLYSNPGFQSATPGYYNVSGGNNADAAPPASASQFAHPGATEENDIATQTISTSATHAQAASPSGSPFGGASSSSGSFSNTSRTSTPSTTAPGVSTSPLKNILNLDPDAATRHERIAETEVINATHSDPYAQVSAGGSNAPVNATPVAEPTEEGSVAAWAALHAGTRQGGSESAIRAAALVAHDASSRPISRAQLRQVVNVHQGAGQGAGRQSAQFTGGSTTSGDSPVRDAHIVLPTGVSESLGVSNSASVRAPAASTPQRAFSANTGNFNRAGRDFERPSSTPVSTGSSVSSFFATNVAQPAQVSVAQPTSDAQSAPVTEPHPLTIAERIRAKQAAADAAKRTGTELPADVPISQTNSSSRSVVAPSSGVSVSVAVATRKAASSATNTSTGQNVPAEATGATTVSIKSPAPDSPAARLLSIGGGSPNLSGAGTTTTTHTSRTSALDADGGKSTTSASTVTTTEKVAAISAEKNGTGTSSTRDKIAAAGVAAAARKNKHDDDDDDDNDDTDDAESSSSRSATNGTAGLIPEEKKKSKAGCVFLLLLLLLAALLAAYYFLIRPSDAPSYLSTHLQTRTLKSTVKTTGNVKPVKEVNVGSEIPGLVLKVYVDSNDTVKKGDKLAMIDTTKIQQQMDAASAALKNAQARESEANATYNETQLKLGRYKDAFQKSQGKTPSKLELERAQADFDRADALKRAAAESVKEASSQLEVHKSDLGKAVIVAPIDGIVLERKIEPGAVVQPSFQVETLFVIAENLEHVKVVVGVSEADIGKVKSGQKATFTVSAFTGKTFEAEVTKVEKASRIDNNVVVYNTELKIPNTDPNFVLRSGMTADVVISTGESKPGAFVVPISALRFNPNATNSVAKKNESFASKIFRFPARNRGAPVEKGVSLNSIDKPQVWERRKNGTLHAIPVVIGVDDGKDVEISGENLTPETEILFGNF